MTKIAPLKAVIFNREKVGDVSKTVCPPYDVISPAKQQYFRDKDPHNLIHILLSKDTPSADKYESAAKLFKQWQDEKIFTQEEKDTIYFYSQHYVVKGENRIRYGFIARMYLENRTGVFGHEHTRLEPKEDRLRLIRQVKANLSPIFAVFSDRKRIIPRMFDLFIKDAPPYFEITDEEKTTHRVWKVDDVALVKKIQNDMLDEKIFIADGHHRFEVAGLYRDELEKAAGKLSEDAGPNYILTYFTNTDQRGLTIMPIHRFIKLDAPLDLDVFIDGLAEYFDVEEIKDKRRFLFLMEKAGEREHVLGMYKNGKYLMLRLKNVRILDKLISDKPKEYRTLDVCVLNYIILKAVLKMSIEDKGHIDYVHDTEELLERVDKDELSLGFLLNPVKIQQIMDVALTGEKMPPKSTYFYPKVLSGIVINKF